MSLKPTTRALIAQARERRATVTGKRNRVAAAKGLRRGIKVLGSSRVRQNLMKRFMG